MKLIVMLKFLLGTHLTAQSFVTSAPLSSSSIRAAQSVKRVVVIGGGAAGYFSAIECAKLLSESQKKGKDSRNTRYEVKHSMAALHLCLQNVVHLRIFIFA